MTYKEYFIFRVLGLVRFQFFIFYFIHSILLNLKSLVDKDVFITGEIEVGFSNRVSLTWVFRVFKNGEFVSFGDIDTLDGISPTDFLEIGNITAER